MKRSNEHVINLCDDEPPPQQTKKAKTSKSSNVIYIDCSESEDDLDDEMQQKSTTHLVVDLHDLSKQIDTNSPIHKVQWKCNECHQVNQIWDKVCHNKSCNFSFQNLSGK